VDEDDHNGPDRAADRSPSNSTDAAEETGDETDGESGRGKRQAVRDIVKGAGVVYGGLVIEIVIAFLAQLLAARFLSISDFGGVTTGTAVVNLGVILGTLGLSQGLVRYLPRLEEDEQRVISLVATAIVAPFSIVLGGLVFLNAGFIASDIFGDPTVTVSLRIFGAAIPFGAVLTLMIGGIRGRERSRYQVYVENLVRPLTRFGLVIVAVLLGLAQAGFALAYAVPYVVGSAVATALFFRALPDLRAGLAIPRSRTRELVRELLQYSLPFTISGATGFIYRNSDIFLILFLIDSGAVGVYGVAYAAARLLLMFSTAMNYLGTPVASALDKEDTIGDAVEVYRPVLRWLLLVSLPALLPLVIFPSSFIGSVYRPAYAAGGSALAILAAGFAVHNVFSAHGSLLRSAGYSRPIALNSVLGAVTNVGLNLLLIPEFGVTGAAVATVVSYLLMDALLFGEMLYFTGETPISSDLVAPVVLAVPVYVLVWYVSPSVPGTFLWLVGVTGLAGLGYWVLVLFTVGLRPIDVMILRSAQEQYGLEYDLLEKFIRQFS